MDIQKRPAESPFTLLATKKITGGAIVNSPMRSVTMDSYSPAIGAKARASPQKENQTPNELNSAPLPSRKQKFDNAFSQSSRKKARKMKMAEKQVTDDIDTEDAAKVQSELNETKALVKNLEERNCAMQVQIEQYEQEKKELTQSREQLQAQLKEVTDHKDAVSLQLSRVNDELRELEDEKDRYFFDLQETRAKLERTEESLKEYMALYVEESKKVKKYEELLNNKSAELTLKEEANRDLQRKCESIKQQGEELSLKLQQSAGDKQELQKRLQDEGMRFNTSISSLQSQIDSLKKEYFFATALAVKLNLSNTQQSNVEIQHLFEKVISENVPLHQWPQWITKNF